MNVRQLPSRFSFIAVLAAVWALSGCGPRTVTGDDAGTVADVGHEQPAGPDAASLPDVGVGPCLQTVCGTKCVDPRSDTENCGACATACVGGRACVEGNCQCATLGAVAECPAGQVCDVATTGAGNRCFRSCALGSRTCQSGTVCAPVSDASGSYAGVNSCYPNSGGKEAGQGCSSAGDCRPDLACVPSSGAGKVCATHCIVGGGSGCAIGEICTDLAAGKNLGYCRTNTCTAGTSCTPPNPCHEGKISCATGSASCADSSTNVIDGSSCGNGQVCKSGVCTACTAGTACTPTNPCHSGSTTCGAGGPGCLDTGSNVPDGTTCGAGQICKTGGCISCVAGSVCTPANVCHTGTTTCGAGGPGCTDTLGNVANGTSCGAGGVVCTSGSCGAPCVAGGSCTPPNPCRTGVVSCSTGSPSCADGGADLADGTTCGTNQICQAGTCTSCSPNAPCTPTNACHRGAVTCGATIGCADTGTNATDGTACGTGGACKAGSCGAACVPGGSCTPSNACHVGKITCPNGVSACTDQGTNQPAGSSCGTNQVCNSFGGCIFCTAGVSCSSANICKNGAIDCSSGASVCVDSGDKTDGTNCGFNQVCSAGVCSACTAGATCVPANPCKTGMVSCSTGKAVCTETGSNVANFTSCTGGACYAGACTTFTLTVDSGDAQSAPLDQSVALPVVVKMTNAAGAVVTGATVTGSGQTGSSVNPGSGVTDANGKTSFVPRVGRAAGVYTFNATGAGATATFTATATSPASGTLYTVVNATHSGGATPVPTAGAAALTGTPESLAVAADGTIYFLQNTTNCCNSCYLRKLTPQGELQAVAGTGVCGDAGDNGPASSAQVSYAAGLALDEAKKLLYLASSDRVRVIDLATGVMSLYAGTGSAPAPGYGDGGPATSGNLSGVSQISIRPSDGALYIADSSHARIRRVDPVTGAISSFLVANTSCSGGVSLYDCSTTSRCRIAWDNADNAFVSGRICAAAVPTASNGIVRRSPSGVLTHVAGKTGGVTTDGVPATTSVFQDSPQMIFDGAGNLYAGDYNDNRVRRIDSATGGITTVVGTGTAAFTADSTPAAGAAITQPVCIALDAQQNLYIGERGSFSLRAISGVGRTSPGSATLSVLTGGAQNIFPSAIGASMVAKLVDGTGAALSNYTIFWSSLDAGGALYVNASATNFVGSASASARGGLAAGPYRFAASFLDLHGNPVSGTPSTFTLTVGPPPAGSIFTAANVNHSGGSSALPAAASLALIGGPEFVATASDGTIYFVQNTTNCCSACFIRKLTPAGEIQAMAGNGTCSSTGDNGLAAQASLDYTTGFALDEPRKLMYVATSDRVRVIDLVSGVISLVAGTGSAPSPGYGDGGPATSAALSAVTGVAVRPSDGTLLIADSGHNEIRKVDPASGFISTFFASNSNGCSTAMNLYDCSGASRCRITFDSADNLFISGRICGPAATGIPAASTGVIKRTPAGVVSHVAGRNGGVTSEGALATSAVFTDAPVVVFDASGTLFLDDSGSHKVRKIDPSNATISTVAGTGTAGSAAEYGVAASEPLNNPTGIAFTRGTAAGHLIVLDRNNFSIRIVW